MRNLILGLSLGLLSLSATATGGFTCTTVGIENQIEIWGTTGRVHGNPIVGDLGVNITNGPELRIPTTQVVGYWNMGEDFKLAIVDDQAMGFIYYIEAKQDMTADYPVALGTLEVADGSKYAVKCELE